MCTVGLLAAVAGAAFVGGRMSTTIEGNAAVASQAEAAQPADQMEMPKGMMVGPHHKHLEQMVGDWEGTVRFKMDPQSDWQESSGTAHREMAMGGRFLIEHVTAEMEGMGQFKGMGITGYNTLEGHYEGAWIENMATYISTSTGEYDEDSETFTFKGEMLDPMTGDPTKTMMTLDASEDGKEVWAGYWIMPDGSRVKSFEGTFTRAD
jgi:hypothetical protein